MMHKGKCLCGSATWEFTGEPTNAYHCHCKMCRKLHGATFASFYLIPSAQFNWSSDTETVQRFNSSDELSRAFCNVCGSALPAQDIAEETWYVPSGSHANGPAIDAHIFVDDIAPWHAIEDKLPQHSQYPENSGIEPLPTKAADPLPADAPEHCVRGSCQCGAVAFHVTEPFKVIHNCHCSRCRQARAAAHTTNGFTSVSGVDFYRGKDRIKLFKVADAKFFTHAFCDSCGSGVPRLDQERGIAAIPIGALDDDPIARPVDHIFVGNKADWYEIAGSLPQFETIPN